MSSTDSPPPTGSVTAENARDDVVAVAKEIRKHEQGHERDGEGRANRSEAGDRESDYQELLQTILRVKHGRHFFNPAGAALT